MALIDRPTQLRLRRTLRLKRRNLLTAVSDIDDNLQKNLFSRFERFLAVKRFAFGWIFLVLVLVVTSVFQTIALNDLYQVKRPTYGGVYNDGLIGTYSNANPIYATGTVDGVISKLLFSGLLTLDGQNNLVGDLAEGYTASENGKSYTVTLRDNLKWHDGKPLTADDVVYTFQLIQNPDVRSPYFSSWQGINVSKTDDATVTFTLPSALAAFPYSLTMGILPKHLVSTIPPSAFRGSSFNTSRPVGSGPFVWDTLQVGSATDAGHATALISMMRNENYHRGRPMIDSYVIHTYEKEEQLVQAFKNRDIIGMGGLKSSVPEMDKLADVTIQAYPTTAAVMTFFKQSSEQLGDVQVRRALVAGADVDSIIASLRQNLKPIRSPILPGQSGYDASLVQTPYDPIKAAAILDQAGWVKGTDGIRSKAGKRLSFRLYAEDTKDNQRIVPQLTRAWKVLGIEAIPILQQPMDLQTTIELHTYDALLYGISIGPDPDVYAYWHSSQSDVRTANRLNFSEYKSTAADTALEGGRTRTDPVIRTQKYRPFLKAWQEDAPALGMYQPKIYYYTRGVVANMTEHVINTENDRYNDVYRWSIASQRFTE